MTNECTIRQSKFLASALGLDGGWKSPAPKTGYVLLVDPKSRRVLGKLTKNDTVKAMSTALDRALAKAR